MYLDPSLVNIRPPPPIWGGHKGVPRHTPLFLLWSAPLRNIQRPYLYSITMSYFLHFQNEKLDKDAKRAIWDITKVLVELPRYIDAFTEKHRKYDSKRHIDVRERMNTFSCHTYLSVLDSLEKQDHLPDADCSQERTIRVVASCSHAHRETCSYWAVNEMKNTISALETIIPDLCSRTWFRCEKCHWHIANSSIYSAWVIIYLNRLSYL